MKLNSRSEWLEEHLRLGERRNTIVSVCSGLLFFIAWWLIIDASIAYPSDSKLPHAAHACGVMASIAFLMINAVPNSAITGDDITFETGRCGTAGPRIFVFVGFVIAFSSLIAASWVLFGLYVVAYPTAVTPPLTTAVQSAVKMLSTTVASSSVTISTYSLDNTTVLEPRISPLQPGLALFFQNLLILFASFLFKFGRKESE